MATAKDPALEQGDRDLLNAYAQEWRGKEDLLVRLLQQTVASLLAAHGGLHHRQESVLGPGQRLRQAA